MHSNPGSHGVAGAPRRLLRAEGLLILALAVLLYSHAHFSWILFALLFLLPDLSMLGYLLSPRVGAISYNAVHTYVGPIALGMVGLITANAASLAVALIWSAHIGLDRLLGFGLKYPSGFGDTHLGLIGRKHADRGPATR